MSILLCKYVLGPETTYEAYALPAHVWAVSMLSLADGVNEDGGT